MHHMESSPLFELGRERPYGDEWDEYFDNECRLQEASVETEMAALRPIHTISTRRSLLFDDTTEAPLCSLSPFLDDECCTRSPTPSPGSYKRRWWKGRMARSATFGFAVCLVLVAIMMGWFASNHSIDSGGWATTDARVLTDAFDDDFRIIFPESGSMVQKHVSAALERLFGDEIAAGGGRLRNMGKGTP